MDEVKEKTNLQLVTYDPHKLKAGVKVKVLEEDDYVKDLEKIITRDFFPDLERLEAQSQYLEALEKKDYSKLRMLHNKYSVLCQRDADTPVIPSFGKAYEIAGETSVRSNSSKKPTHNPASKDGSDLSLDKYLATHTSEDNAAFSEMIDKVEKHRRERMSWCYEAEEKARLAVESSKDAPKSIEGKKRSSAPESWPGYEVHNSVLFVPAGVPFSEKEKAKRAADASSRTIVHANTHLPSGSERENIQVRKAIEAASQQRTAAAQLQGRVGPDGKELFPSAATPAVRGFSFVPSLPSPSPSVQDSPLMTWGAVESTPLALDNHAATPLLGAGFRVPDVPRREKLAMELADNARRQRTEKKAAINRLKGRLASPASSSSARLASMSPAARSLSAKLRIGSGLRISPMPRREEKKTPVLQNISTPSSSVTSTPRSTRELTAGLLQLTSKKK